MTYNKAKILLVEDP